MKSNLFFVGLLIVLGTATNASAGLYKCMTGGQVVYSDKPCEFAKERSAGRLDNKPMISIGRQNSAGTVSQTTSDEAIGGGSKSKKRVVVKELPSQQLINECLDYFRPMLRDPRGVYADKAQFQSVRNLEKPDVPEWREVVLDGRATNAFGGYVSQRFNCILNSAGSVDQEQSKVYKAFFTLGVNPE